jgi:trehalose 6-phosphate synthase/phosphatase
MTGEGRLILISNRLPITASSSEGQPRLEPSGGGLVSALLPALRESRGRWVGWTGTNDDPSIAALMEDSFEPVFLTTAERDLYYRGFSNEILWPLLHGLPSRCRFDSSFWSGYCQVNEKFADAVEAVARPDSVLWVHDYHLMVLPCAIRARGMKQRLGYFHHIPFPPPDIFAALPWRAEILGALMACDLIGFQTQRDRRNFIACVREFVPHKQAANHAAKILACPVSIDFEEFAREGLQPEIVAASATMRSQLRTSIILGVDRLDYTKGIPERLHAFEKLLERNPEFRGKVTMLQLVVPSREDVPEYEQLRVRIETLVGTINGKYSTPGWTPVHYFYRSVSRDALVAFYLAADIALVTPLRDGMNLVAKEFCAARADNQGVLILSEFAGVAEELRFGALIVNPHDTEGVMHAIARALRMGEDEQRMRMSSMRTHIRTHDVGRWSRFFISRLAHFALDIESHIDDSDFNPAVLRTRVGG